MAQANDNDIAQIVQAAIQAAIGPAIAAAVNPLQARLEQMQLQNQNLPAAGDGHDDEPQEFEDANDIVEDNEGNDDAQHVGGAAGGHLAAGGHGGPNVRGLGRPRGGRAAHGPPHRQHRKVPMFNLNDGPKKFQRWKDKWYLLTEQILSDGYTPRKEELEIQSEFQYAMADDVLDWFESKLIDKRNVEAALAALEEFVYETTNPYQIYLECAKRVQEEHENIHTLNMWVRERVKNMIRFKTWEEAVEWQHKVIFLTSLKSEKTRKRLIEEGKDKTYEEWVEIAKSNELTEKTDVGMMSHKPKMTAETHYVSTYHANRGRGNGRGGRGGQQQQQRGRSQTREQDQDRERSLSRSREDTCTYCGKAKHAREQCPANGMPCRRCFGTGHFSTMCRASDVKYTDNPQPKVNSVETHVAAKLRILNTETGNVENVSSISTGKWPLESLESIKVTLSTSEGRSRTILMLPDTGANINLIHLDDARKIWPDGFTAATTTPSIRTTAGHTRSLRRRSAGRG